MEVLKMNKIIISVSIILSLCFGCTYTTYGISDTDRTLFYKTVEAEAQEGGYNEKLAVANVIANRTNNPGFPNTIGEVITEKHTSKKTGKTYWQFCVIRNGSYNRVKITQDTIDAVDDCLNGKWIISDKICFFNTRNLNSYAKRNQNYSHHDNIHDFFY